MEIITKQFERNKLGKMLINQFMLDEDYNVPDNRHDVKRVVIADAALKIDEIKPIESYLRIIGKLEFHILYETDSMDYGFSGMKGQLPFEEMIYAEEGADDSFEIKEQRVDLRVQIIHSRKLRIKAIVEIGVQSEKRCFEEITIDAKADCKIYKKQENVELLKLHTSKKDTCRIKEEVILPGTKESIGVILWSDISNRKLDTKLADGEFQFVGELLAFCFYESPDGKIDWIEQSVPYSGKIGCVGVDETMFHHVKANLEDVHVDMRLDEDGEMRVIGIDGTMKFSLAIYEEEEIGVLRDLYSLEEHCIMNTKPVYCEQLYLQNHSKCKVMERLSVPELGKDVLQICHSKGHVRVEQMEEQEDGVLISGILYVSFLYVKSSDEVPFDVWQGVVPFSHLVECTNKGKDLKYDVTTLLEQLNISLQGGNEIEVKAVLSFRGFFRKEEIIMKIENVHTEPITLEEYENRPSIVGYIVREGDDLWKLAKTYCTSEELIREMNELSEREIKPGDRLLIFKENMGIL